MIMYVCLQYLFLCATGHLQTVGMKATFFVGAIFVFALVIRQAFTEEEGDNEELAVRKARLAKGVCARARLCVCVCVCVCV